MARSERFVAPSDEQIQKWKEEDENRRRFTSCRRQLLEAALRKLKKDELVELLLRLDVFDPAPRWSIEAAVDLQKPLDLTVFDLRQAIAIATRVDETLIGHDFDYSWQAYEEVERGLKQLLKHGELETAKMIAVELMYKASRQVECSDEGQMAGEIEACLEPIIDSVAIIDETNRNQWASKMLLADRGGIICRERLEKLAATIT